MKPQRKVTSLMLMLFVSLQMFAQVSRDTTCCDSITSVPLNLTDTIACDSIFLLGPADSCLTYQWYQDTFPISGATSVGYMVETSGTYHLVVSNNCYSSISNEVEITLGHRPFTNIIHSDVSCYGDCDGSATVQVSSEGNYFYSWSNGEMQQSIDNLCPGVYYVTVTDSLGCGSSVDSVVITQPSGIKILNTCSPLMCRCQIGKVCTKIKIGGGTPPYTILNAGWTYIGNNEWKSCVTIGQFFSVYVLDAAGCTEGRTFVCSRSMKDELSGNELLENFDDSHLIIYPNPADEEVIVELDEVVPNTFLSLHDITGKKIRTQVAKSYNEIDVSTLPSGIYILDLSGEEVEPVRRKLIVR